MIQHEEVSSYVGQSPQLYSYRLPKRHLRTYRVHWFSMSCISSLANAGKHQTLVIPGRFPLDTACQTPSVLLLVRRLDVGQGILIPVEANHAGYEKVILGSHACHGLFQKSCGVHVLVDNKLVTSRCP